MDLYGFTRRELFQALLQQEEDTISEGTWQQSFSSPWVVSESRPVQGQHWLAGPREQAGSETVPLHSERAMDEVLSFGH